MILSRGRSKTIKTTNIFPNWIEVVVPESEKDAYTNAIQNPLITTPDGIIGLGMLRNWVLDNVKEETVIMVDDDIQKFYRISGELTETINDPEEIVQILINTAVMAKEAGAKVFGFSQRDIRAYYGCEPFYLNRWIGTIIGICGRRYKFRDDKYKVDIDYCLQNLLVERIVFVDGRYLPSNIKQINSGGNSLFRNQEEYEASLTSLKEKWGDALRIQQYKNDKRIQITIKRKQNIKL